MIRRVTAAALTVGVLAGCGTANTRPDATAAGGGDGLWIVTSVRVGDRVIPCIAWDAGNASGLSCDWGAPQ